VNVDTKAPKAAVKFSNPVLRKEGTRHAHMLRFARQGRASAARWEDSGVGSSPQVL